MSAAASQNKLGELIELHFDNEDGKVRVIPADNTLLLMSVEEAISACRASKQQLEFNAQYSQLLNKLGGWIDARKGQIAQAYLTLRDAGLLLLIVTKAAEYGDELEAQITELDMEIANDTDYHLIDLSVLAIPSCSKDSVSSFLSRKMRLSFVVDGDRE